MSKSTHEAIVYAINEILPHTNADNLEVVRLNGIGGYTCIVRKGQYKINDLIVFIVPDSLVDTKRPEFEFLDPKGEEKPHRIRVKKIRGFVSQGLILPCPEGFTEGMDAAEYYGVTHWEPPVKGQAFTVGKKWTSVFYCLQHDRSQGVLEGKVGKQNVYEDAITSVPGVPFPHYDIETLRKYTHVFEDGEPVFITEKLHGQNGSYIFHEGQLWVRSRNFYKLGTDNDWWRACTPEIKKFCEENPDWTLWGEVVGNNPGFMYGCQNGERKLFAFDVMKPDGRYLSSFDFLEMCEKYNIPTVPVLYKETPFDIDMILKLIEEDSRLPNAVCMEGVVIKPIAEQWHNRIGRKFLKVVSNRYYELS
jgi:hypothetical protein